MRIESIQDVAAIATAVGAFFAAFQLFHTRARAITTFEDSLAHEYREIAGKLPTAALLGEILTPEMQKVNIQEFYRYFDLTIIKSSCGRLAASAKRHGVFGPRGFGQI
jgi:uncharacterized membrane protein YfbV (UPF0208 family)